MATCLVFFEYKIGHLWLIVSGPYVCVSWLLCAEMIHYLFQYRQ